MRTLGLALLVVSLSPSAFADENGVNSFLQASSVDVRQDSANTSEVNPETASAASAHGCGDDFGNGLHSKCLPPNTNQAEPEQHPAVLVDKNACYQGEFAFTANRGQIKMKFQIKDNELVATLVNPDDILMLSGQPKKVSEVFDTGAPVKLLPQEDGSYKSASGKFAFDAQTLKDGVDSTMINYFGYYWGLVKVKRCAKPNNG